MADTMTVAYPSTYNNYDANDMQEYGNNDDQNYYNKSV